MRDLINMINERGLTPAELAKHGGAYRTKLAQLAAKGPVPVEPSKQAQYGAQVQLAPETVRALAGTGLLPPAPMFVLDDGTVAKGSWGTINKGAEYTGIEEKKAYNAGHLAELFMGLAVSAKFFNLGNPITVDQVVDMFTFSQITAHTNPKTNKITSNIVFTISRDIAYPTTIKGRPDYLTFKGVIPGKSAEAFISQVKTRQFTSDVQAVLASAVKYVNEAPSVEASIKKVQQDPNTNQINVVSDGTSDAKMTKADLVLSIDGKKINLFSLKTYSSDTLGQISGVGFDQVSSWFKTSFGIDLSKYKKQIEQAAAKSPATGFELLLHLYDLFYPQIEALVDRQSPGQEATMVRQFADAANYHARGAGAEDVEIVKLDDKIKSGNYKILKFSDNLYDAMKMLDLETRYLKGNNGRTIQIWAKPQEGIKVDKGANKLCQFRTQKMGDSYRNYFESGPMLEKLTQVNQEPVKEELAEPEVVEPRKDNVRMFGRKFQR